MIKTRDKKSIPAEPALVILRRIIVLLLLAGVPQIVQVLGHQVAAVCAGPGLLPDLGVHLLHGHEGGRGAVGL